MLSASLSPDGNSVAASYSITGSALTAPGTIDFYWASGTGVAYEIGSALKVPAQAAMGNHTAAVSLSSLGTEPADAAYILAVADSPSADPNHRFVLVALPHPPPPPPPPIINPGGPHGTRIVVKAKPRPANPGQPVALTATVRTVGHTRAIPGGSVTFLDGAAVLSTVALTGGRAGLTVSSLPIGRNLIRVNYTPASGFAPSAATMVEIVRPHRSRGKAVSAREPAAPSHPNLSAVNSIALASAISTGTAPAIGIPTVLGPLTQDGRRAARVAGIRAERRTPAVGDIGIAGPAVVRRQAVNQPIVTATETPEILLDQD
jgi:hypothetical protein